MSALVWNQNLVVQSIAWPPHKLSSKGRRKTHLAVEGNRGPSDFVVQTCCLELESFQVRHGPFEIAGPNIDPTVLHSVVIVQTGERRSCTWRRKNSAFFFSLSISLLGCV
jgi:hypothetical protein